MKEQTRKAQKVCTHSAIHYGQKGLDMIAAGDDNACIYVKAAYQSARLIGTARAMEIARKAERAFYSGNIKLACRWAIYAARVA